MEKNSKFLSLFFLLGFLIISPHSLAEMETVVDKKKVIEQAVKLKSEDKKDAYKNMMHLLAEGRLIPLQAEKKAVESYNLPATGIKAFLESAIDVHLPKKTFAPGEICNLASCDSSSVCRKVGKKSKLGSGIPAGGKCQFHSDCQSQKCVGLGKTKNAPGTCAKPKKCFKGLKKDMYCTKAANLCLDPLRCREINRISFGIGECNKLQKACSEHTDCCSNLCYKNKCVRNFRCQDCLEKGQKVSGGKECCDGLYPKRGICSMVSPL